MATPSEADNLAKLPRNYMTLHSKGTEAQMILFTARIAAS